MSDCPPLSAGLTQGANPRAIGLTATRPRTGALSGGNPRASTFSGDRPRTSSLTGDRPRSGDFCRHFDFTPYEPSLLETFAGIQIDSFGGDPLTTF